MIHLREPSNLTLRDLADELNTDSQNWGGVTNEMRLVQESGDNRMFFNFGNVTVPVTKDGLDQVCTFMGAPRNFIGKVPVRMQMSILNDLFTEFPDNMAIQYDDGGIHEVFAPSRVRLAPRQIVQSVIKVVGEDSQLVEWGVDPDELFFDVMVPLDSDRAVGGDRQIGDISRGGVRIVQNRKQNLAPTVNTFLYRLACTNGMVIPETGLTIDARGNSVEMMLAELELAAEHAFSQVEDQIAHYYDLRNQRIEGDVTQAVIQVARERGLPDRMGMTLARRVPADLSLDGLGHEPTMFDLVNLITNQANDPAIRSRRGPRRELEMAGGTLVQHLTDRCGNCQQSLN